MTLRAPFPAFGGKRDIADLVWQRFGQPKQYIEPFCFSAAVLLAAPAPASLEVIGDTNGFVANFWRACIAQPAEVARFADYPVSHIDLGARHQWLMEQRERLAEALQDCDWPGDAKVAGWWLWGQCCWIGSGWCEWERAGKIPHVSDAGMGVQAAGKIPHVSDAGMGVQAAGQIPHVGNAGMGGQSSGPDTACRKRGDGRTGNEADPHVSECDPHVADAGDPHLSSAVVGHHAVEAHGQVPRIGCTGTHITGRMGDQTGAPQLWTSAGRTAWVWLHKLAARLERVRVIHGDWSRTLNHHYGADSTAIFFDPPYENFEGVYRVGSCAQQVADWCRENARLRIALCGHIGDYDLPGWDAVPWKRKRLTYSSDKTTDQECVWFSPACLPATGQIGLFGGAA
jgi:hypothetical protein